jgi:hypothetical protein
MNKFDDKFVEQVKSAFGSYNANHLANEGWNALKQKQSQPKRFALLLPLWAKAASIAILLLGSAIVSYLLTNQPVDAIQHEAQIPFANPEKDSSTQDKEVAIAQNNLTQPKKPKVKSNAKPYEASGEPQVLVSQTPSIKSPEASLFDNASETITEIPTFSDEKEVVATTTPSEVFPEVTPNPTDMWAAIIQEEPKPQSKNQYSLGLSGMMAKSSDLYSTNPGVAVGFYAQHSLGNRVSVRPGLALARHSYGMESLTGSYDMVTSPNLSTDATGIDVRSNEMDIVTLEVPINFVLELIRGRQGKLFVSAGASSIFYLSQQFAGTYSNRVSENVYNSQTGQYEQMITYQTIDVENRYKAFSHTDLFGLANLSAGYSFPFGKSSILIEPFVQIPLRKLTSNNLNIGFGGVSVKYILPR